MPESRTVSRLNSDDEGDDHHHHTVRTPLRADHHVDFSWRNISYRVLVKNPAYVQDKTQPKKIWRTLLNDMSGVARGGRVLAIMGPSGAGKTTLMGSFLGRLNVGKAAELEGCCYVNGIPVDLSLKKLFSMVAQDDIVMGKETPRDALNFSARIRLGISADEAAELTDALLERLHLTKCADTYIGVPGLIKGISGGEKKRVNIGSELITNPYIMILDEPTTGLDSVNAMRVGELLRELAKDEGRTVICTIHTPSSELFGVFDDLLLIGKANVIYHGAVADAPEYFASIGHPVPPRTNPSEFYMNLLQLPEPELMQLADAFRAYRTSPQGRSNLSISHFPTPALGEREALEKKTSKNHCSKWLQFVLLHRRSFRMFRRDPAATTGRLFQTLFLAFLFGLFFFNLDDSWQGVDNVSGVCFSMTVNHVFMAAMPGVVTFPKERAVFLMEQSAEAYNPFLYLFAKVAAEMPMNIIFPTVFCLIVYFMLDLLRDAGAFFIFWLILTLLSCTGLSFGIFASALFSNVQVSLAFAPLMLLPMMVVGGLMANTDRLDPGFIWLNYISFPRYCFLGIVVNQFRDRNLCPDNDPRCRFKTGKDYLTFLGFENWKWWYSVIGLLAIMLVLWVVAAIALTLYGRSRHSNYNYTTPSSLKDNEEDNNGNNKEKKRRSTADATTKNGAADKNKREEESHEPHV